MSRFEELRQSYVDARAGYFARRDACSQLATLLLQGLEAHIQSPLFQFQFVSYSGEARTNKSPSAASAAWLAPDGHWHYRVGLEVNDAKPGVFTKNASRQLIITEFIVQPDGDVFSVRINGRDNTFTMPVEGGTPDQAAFNEFVFEQMLGTYQKGGLRFFEGQDDVARMVGAHA